MMRKGQAAMEFLMTYGWAILVVLVAIGALAYFGVLNPSRFLPESCTLSPGIGCDDFAVTPGAAGTSAVNLVVRNGIGDSLDFSSVYLDINNDRAYTDGTDCGNAGAVLNPGALPDGQTATWTFNDCPTITAGQSFKAGIMGVYVKGTSALTHNMVGQIAGRA